MTLLGQARNGYPALRIFVFGLDVTDDVTSVTVNWSDADRAPSTAEFVLVNERDKYIVTPTDLMTLYPDLDADVALPDMRAALANDPRINQFVAPTPGVPVSALQQATNALVQAAGLRPKTEVEYLNQVRLAQESLDRQVRENLRSIQFSEKRAVLTRKFNKVQDVSQPDFTETGEKVDRRRAAYLQGQAFRYPFVAGAPIFHSNDPVRIFLRDPFNQRVWYHMFAGFVSDWTKSTSVDNSKTLVIRCEDVLRMLRYARMAMNPGLFDIRALEQDEDLVFRTFFREGLTELTLPEIIYTLLFGPARVGTADRLNVSGADLIRLREESLRPYERSGVNGDETIKVPRYGVGAFNFDRSATFVLGQNESATDIANVLTPPDLRRREVSINGSDALAVYQSFVDHRVRTSDLETMALDGHAISRAGLRLDQKTGDVFSEEIVTKIGENPHIYPVDGGRLIMLLPANLGPNTNRAILEKSFVDSVATQTTWSNRLEIIYNVLERIEFRMFATPRGDVCVEMPLYDFQPSDFGEVAVDSQRARRSYTPNTHVQGLEYAARDSIGPLAPHYRIMGQDLMDADLTFSDEHVRTQFRCSWQNLQGYPEGQTADVIGQLPEVVTLRGLVPQFGVRAEQATPTIYVANPEAAQIYCQLKLRQWNADAISAQIDMLPQLRLGPNRPIEVDDGPYVASVRSISHTLDWDGGDMHSSVGLNYVRVWDGLIDEDAPKRRDDIVSRTGGRVPVYSSIGGAASTPLNYALLFRRQGPGTSTRERARGGVARALISFTEEA
jgi:hypothetical protein